MKYARWGQPRFCGAAVEGVPTLVGKVLAARGMTEEGQAAEFWRADLGLLKDPWLLADMDRAVARLEKALQEGETIAVYGDYDVDGVTATCLLYDYLQSRGGRVLWYIPRRLEDGYGLNIRGLDSLREAGASLIVTVDCGITAVEEVHYAKSIGLDVIVTDHHACKDVLPEAAAVVNPQRPDCPYPFKGLAGVGVALKLAMAMGSDIHRYADLAAMGTVADVMPLLEENRAIVALGLEKMRESPRPGLQALLDAVGFQGQVTAVTLGYTLAPRLNAAGRLGVTQVALELLLAPTVEEALPLAQELCELNRQRQELEGEIFETCESRVESGGGQGAAIVLWGEGWHQGVVGIVASRLADRFGKPAFIISLENGMGKGSCRSAGGVSVFRALEECGPLLEEFGGHAMAAGFTVREENLPALQDALNAWVEAQSGGEGDGVLEVDCVLEDGAALTVEEVEALELLEPHGAGNPKPVFVLSRCVLTGCSRVGALGKHMRFRVREKGRRFSCIFFSCPKDWAFRPEDRLELAFTPQINEYQGQRSVQLVVCDVRPAPTRAQVEREIYHRFHRGERLSPQEALSMLPTRHEFAALWRCIQEKAPLNMESSTNLSRQVGHALGGQEIYAKTMVGLEVFQERGLIELEVSQERVNLKLLPWEEKVDLNASPIMMRLKGLAEG